MTDEAKRTRPVASAAERRIWAALKPLRDRGVHIRRQHPIGRYFADFAIVNARLAIEIDGPFHAWPENLASEEQRQAYIENMGWRVLRISARDAGNTDLVFDKVSAALPPSPRGEGEGGWGEAQPSPNKAPKRIERRTRGNRVLPARAKNERRDSPHPLPPPRAGRGLRERLIAQIAISGPITIAEYMRACLHDPEDGYYATRPGIGADFVTAPEISQMFGELVGAWCAHEWRQIGAPSPLRLVELGPGTGALMRDALRAAKAAPGFTEAARVTLIDASPALRERQAEALRAAAPAWARDLRDLAPAPTLLIANELLDCLPIRQFLRAEDGWRERLVGARRDALTFGLAPMQLADMSILPDDVRDEVGAVAEIALGAEALLDDVARVLAPGRALFIDYGSQGGGDSLQAIVAHRKVDPLAEPGRADLTAHVDFAAIARFAERAGLIVHGPIRQARFLRALGLDQRAEALTRAHPDRAARIAREHARLTAPDQMGDLFKVICLSSPDLPAPAGFA